jgi:hypothetical protein
MKSTKVEVQEIKGYDVGPQVEEIASYSYTIHEEENSTKPENGVLVEEFSENEDSKDKEIKERRDSKTNRTSLNRGVSIVSISDDDTSAKGISRDISADDLLSSGFIDDSDTANASTEAHDHSKGRVEEVAEKKSLYNETIIEERSIDESLSEPQIEKVDKADKRESKLSDGQITKESCERKTSISNKSQTVEELSSSQSTEKQNADIEESKLTKQSSVQRKSISQEKSQDSDNSRKSSIQEKSLSRQSSKIERLDSVESKTFSVKTISRENSMKGVISDVGEEEDDDIKRLLERSQRQRSVLDEILDKQEKQDEYKLSNKSEAEDDQSFGRQAKDDDEAVDVFSKDSEDELFGKKDKREDKQEKESAEISNAFGEQDDNDEVSEKQKKDEVSVNKIKMTMKFQMCLESKMIRKLQSIKLINVMINWQINKRKMMNP